MKKKQKKKRGGPCGIRSPGQWPRRSARFPSHSSRTRINRPGPGPDGGGRTPEAELVFSPPEYNLKPGRNPRVGRACPMPEAGRKSGLAFFLRGR